MKDIKCGLTNCKFNRGYCCCAKGICVSGNTDCKTFSMGRDKTQNEFANDFIKADYSIAEFRFFSNNKFIFVDLNFNASRSIHGD